MSDAVRPTFARGWYGYTDDEIQIAMDAILRPETVPQESHMTIEPKREASPIVDKTLILAVAVDLVADQRIKLQRLESRVEILALRLAGQKKGNEHERGDPTNHDKDKTKTSHQSSI